ncbi:MAG: antibiotic biosynthesis monooxygenase [Mycobacterium sp.]|nr:antibiotic biosynthesis monooxygenase [Mycobacterium sp.]
MPASPPSPDSGAAMLIIGRRIRDGRDDDYLSWEKKTTAAAARYPGFQGVEVKPPTAIQPDWAVVYRFDSVPHLRNWLNSSTRQSLLDEAADIFDGPATQQVISEGTEIADPLVTVVVTNRVDPDQVEAFLAWRRKMARAESNFPGFRGSEVFRPIEGVQDEWTTVYRFDTGEHLESWMTSPERHRLLAEAQFGDFRLRTIDQSFGNWFTFAGSAVPPPSDFKTSIAVWLGLYPTVVLLTLLTTPLHMPFWLAMLVGNLLSSFVMSFVTMPYYTNPILRWWLTSPPAPRRPWFNAKGILLVLVINGLWAVVFYALTTKTGIAP